MQIDLLELWFHTYFCCIQHIIEWDRVVLERKWFTVYIRVSQKKSFKNEFFSRILFILAFSEGESDFEYFLEFHGKNPFWKIGLRIEVYVCSQNFHFFLTMQMSRARLNLDT